MAVEEQVAAPINEMENLAVQRKDEDDDNTAGNEFIVEGPALPADFKVNEKKLKKVIKEGGKRGVEIEGAAAMGGLMFFCTSVDEPEGKLELTLECMKGMNAISDPSEEERKGGAGKLGKMILSMTDDVLTLVTYVPKNHHEKCKANEWLKHVVDLTTDMKTDKVSEGVQTFEGVSGDAYAGIVLKKDGELGIFPLKMRDTAITHAYAYLKARDLFPDADDDDDDEYVFGDEDFP